MTTLDLQTWLSLISTVAIVLALVFAGVQVREANRARRDEAAVALLQSAQGDTWTRAMNAMAQLPAKATAEQVDAAGEWATTAVVDFGLRLETMGYMVFSRLVSPAKVDDLIGGVVLMFWSRDASRWAMSRCTRSIAAGAPDHLCMTFALAITPRRPHPSASTPPPVLPTR